MKLSEVLDRLQASKLQTAASTVTEKNVETRDVDANGDSQNAIVPLSAEQTAQGLLAVGGCRQCSKTFTDRLELIHHFCDHFPSIFYSFESAQTTPASDLMTQLATAFAAKDANQNNMLNSRAVPETKVEVDEPESPAQEGRSDRSSSTVGPRKPSHDSISPPVLADPSVIGASWAAKNLKKRIRERTQSVMSVQESSSSDLPYHMCPHCCLTFAETRAYNEHLDTHKSQEGSMSSSVQCGFCEMTFSNSYLLTEHQKLHSKACGSCGKAFMTEFDFNLHVGTHTGFTYDCKDCGRCFPCRKTLAEHNKSHRIVLASTDDNADGTDAVSPRHGSPNNETISPMKKPKLDIGLRIATSMVEKDGRPESLFDGNPYYNELLRESPRKRRPRGSRMNNVRQSSPKNATGSESNGKESTASNQVPKSLTPTKFLMPILTRANMDNVASCQMFAQSLEFPMLNPLTMLPMGGLLHRLMRSSQEHSAREDPEAVSSVSVESDESAAS